MSDSLLSLAQVLSVVPVGRTTLRRMVAEGSFPCPVSISLKKRAWFHSDVQNWIESLRPTENNEEGEENGSRCE